MKLKNQLCDLAYRRGSVENPGACQKCISPCEYGRQWLRQLGMEAPKRASEPLYSELPKEGLLSIKELVFKLNRGVLSEKI